MLDALIVGAGYAGLTAAFILEQAGLKVLILEGYNKAGGQILFYPSSKIIYNLTEFSNISGPELIKRLLFRLKTTKIIYNTTVISIQKAQHYIIRTEDSEYIVPLVIFATGYGTLQKKQLGLKCTNIYYELNELWQNHSIIVLGGGNTAFEQALYLSNKNNIVLIHRRSEFTANKSLIAKSSFPILIYSNPSQFLQVNNNLVTKFYDKNLEIKLNYVLCCYGFNTSNALQIESDFYKIGDAYQRVPFDEIDTHIKNTINDIKITKSFLKPAL